MACHLAVMAWERNQTVYIITATDKAGEQLSELMWQYPEGRFLPHAVTGSQDCSHTPVNIGKLSGLNPSDVVINLCEEAVPDPQRFIRILEIVPFAADQRQASSVKYKTYRKLGLKPQTHENIQ